MRAASSAVCKGHLGGTIKDYPRAPLDVAVRIRRGLEGLPTGGRAMMFRTAIVALVVMFLPSSGWAEKRVALVVGNAAYQHAGILANPLNDARDVAAALTDLGFQVLLGANLDKRAFDVKVKEFARALDRANVGLFFYAGHGLQVTGVNYLAATDAKLEAERDLDFETVKVEFVLAQMEREAKTNIVFLDACRDNPLARNLARTMGTRGVNEKGGLAPIKSGLGTFIAFATQPGNVASDGTGRNSPFSTALKKHITAPGLSLTDVMIEVRNDVVGATKGAQVPWDHSALRGRFYFNLLAPGESSEATARRSAIEAEALRKAQEEWLHRKEILVWKGLSLTKQCRPWPPAIVEILKPPLYGTLEMRAEQHVARKFARKGFDHCAGTKGQGRAVYYVIKNSERHRKDTETISLRVRHAGGGVDIQEFEINLGDRSSTRTKLTLVD